MDPGAPAVSTQAAKARRFRALHEAPRLFVMPNAWNAGSARLLAAEGFEALGTTSAGIAYALGEPDGSGRVGRDEMLDEVRRIVRSVDLPVSADLESGYGTTPRDVARTVELAIEAGVVGCNLEDVDRQRPGQLFPIEEAVDRLLAAREAADATGLAFTLTARTDVFLTEGDDRLARAVERCRRLRAAGADCLFVPGVADLATIRALTSQVAAPMNVVMGLSGAPLSIAGLAAAGVRRVSIGGSLARATFGLVRRAAVELREQGTFGYAAGQIPDGELSRFFAGFDAEGEPSS